MPVDYAGTPENCEPLPVPLNVASTTDTTPIEVTTTAVHGLATGDQVYVYGADDNAANGSWFALVTGATTFFIGHLVAGAFVGAVGTMVGGANGTAYDQGFGEAYEIPTNGDPFVAESFTAALEALGDRVTEAWRTMGWSQSVHAGGILTIESFAEVAFQAHATCNMAASSQFFTLAPTGPTAPRFVGNWQVGDGSSASRWHVANASNISIDSGASVLVSGTEVFESGSIQEWIGGKIVGTPVLQNGSTFQIGDSGAGASIDVLALSNISIENTAWIGVAGGGEIRVDGNQYIRTGGKFIVNSGGTFQINSGSLNSMDGDLIVGGASLTRIDLSGGGFPGVPGGRITRKRKPVASSGTPHIDITIADRFFMPASASGVLLTLDGTGAELGDEIEIMYEGGGASGNTQVQDGHYTNPITSSTIVPQRFTATYDGTGWRIWAWQVVSV